MNPRFIEDYHAQRDFRKAFLKALKDDIREYLKDENIRFVDIPWRVKAEGSLLRKVRKNPGAFKTISDVHDFCGLRVITYLHEDIKKALQALERRYEVTEVKDRAPTDPTQFGYSSHHARIKFHQASPQRKKFDNLYAEIQVRTILQHAWAEIEHDLGYKNDVGIPAHLRRRFSLLSGLLEIGDREFDEIRLAIGRHVSDLADRSQSDWSNVSIDSHSLQYFCEKSHTLRDAAERVRRDAGAATHKHHDYIRNISTLDQLRVESLGDLDGLLIRRGSVAVRMATAHLISLGAQSYFADADLLDYLAICEAANIGFDELRQLLTDVQGTGSEAEDNEIATRWFELYQSVNEGALNGSV
jgi:putative GTP pyrophosphokinase